MIKLLLFLVLVAIIGTDVQSAVQSNIQRQANKHSSLRSNRVLTDFPEKTYTLDADFDLGKLVNVNHQLVHDQLQLDSAAQPLSFIWVAASDRGTVVKIDTETGEILGEYRTAPQQNGSPSRTTVDHDGSVWVANRNDVYDSYGSIVHIGLVENGQCEDRNGNGIIDTSTGLGAIKPWNDATGPRGVATAADECIVHYLKVSSKGTRHISVDTNNDVWVSGLTLRKFDKVKGGNYKTQGSGSILRTEGPAEGNYYGGYGGLIDKKGVIWSAKEFLRWDTAKSLTGKNGVNWYGEKFDSYGTCIDSQGNVWVTTQSKGTIRKYDPTGKVIGNYKHGNKYAQGCVVGLNDDVWVAHSKNSKSVGHLKNNGSFVSTINVNDSASGGVGFCDGPTGVAVDNKGKIWATCYNSNTVVRIDPATGKVDKTVRLGSGAGPYNYSDMTGSTLGTAPLTGSWTVIFDSLNASHSWVKTHLQWNGSSVTVKVQSSNDKTSWSPEATVASDGLLDKLLDGQYLKIVAEFHREKPEDSSPVLTDLRVYSADSNDPRPPTAKCKDIIVSTEYGKSTAAVSPSAIDGGSFDPDSLPFTLSLSPGGPFAIGTHGVVLTVTNTAALTSTCNARITVVPAANTAPIAECHDVSITIDADKRNADVSATAVGSTSHDAEDTFALLTLSLSPPSPYSVGMTSVTLTVADTAGAQDTCAATITVKQKPNAVCKDVTVPTDAGLCTTVVKPNQVGGESTDDMGYDNLVLSLNPAGPFSLGDTSVVLSATDTDDLTDSCNAKITVEDESPPFNDGTFPAVCLWPPNHNYWAADAASFITASDNCDGLKLNGSIKSCTSNQPVDSIGDGSFINDCSIVDGKLYIRAERQGNEAPGRLYTITATVTDKAGNSAEFTRVVSVPHDKDPNVKKCIKATVKDKKRTLRGDLVE